MTSALKIINIIVLAVGAYMVVQFGDGGFMTPPVLSGSAFFLIGLAGLIRD